MGTYPVTTIERALRHLLRSISHIESSIRLSNDPKEKRGYSWEFGNQSYLDILEILHDIKDLLEATPRPEVRRLYRNERFEIISNDVTYAAVFNWQGALLKTNTILAL